MKRAGDRVGRIRLLEHLGTGGMGDIFVGRDETLDREVAVKAIRPERLTAETRERLVREAQLLSTLDHENICRIFELVEEGDEAFLILELIRGRNLRRALESGLSQRQKLEVAQRIASALEAAHRNGVVHRDLKLENVMLRDDGVVKVLDFGVARSLDAPPDRPRVGRSGTGRHRPTADDANAAGSEPSDPAFSAFEPVDPAAPVSADESSMPTAGSRPDSSLTLQGEAVGTVAHMSPEQARGEWVSEATDLYSLGLLLQELFTGRSPYPPDLPEEVLWMRAREGDTLAVEGIDPELATLIRELESVRPSSRPTASEVVLRLRRIRNRGQRRLRLAAALGLALLAAAGAAKYTVDLQRERNAALEARREAERRGREAEAVVDFLVGLFRASDPGAARGRDPRASELLERGAEKLGTELTAQPGTRARLLETIARVNRLLGRLEQAEGLYEAALELRRSEPEGGARSLATTESELGDLLRLRGRFAAARQLLVSSVARLERSPRADEAEIAAVLNRLGALELEEGHLDEAARRFERVAELQGDDELDLQLVAAARNNLAIVYVQQGRLAEAGEEHRQVLELRRRLLGEDHPDIAASLNNLAVVRYGEGRLDDASDLMREALAIWREVLGEGHPQVATALSNLGDIAVERYELDSAEGHYRDALERWTSALGPDHPDLAYALHGLGRVYRERGDREAAARWYSRALRLREAALPADHPEVAETRQHLEAVRSSPPPTTDPTEGSAPRGGSAIPPAGSKGGPRGGSL